MGLVGLCHCAFVSVSLVQTFFSWEFCGSKLVLVGISLVQRFFTSLFCQGEEGKGGVWADLDTLVDENNFKKIYKLISYNFNNSIANSFWCAETELSVFFYNFFVSWFWLKFFLSIFFYWWQKYVDNTTSCSKHDTRGLEVGSCSEIRKLCVLGRRIGLKWKKQGFFIEVNTEN